MPLTGLQSQTVESLVLDVDHSIALPAEQVVMLVSFPVETGTRAGVVQSANETQTHKRVQNAIHRRARKTWNAILDGLVYLVSRGMVVALQDRLEDISALHGERQPSLATEGLKLLQSLLDFKSVHEWCMTKITNRYSFSPLKRSGEPLSTARATCGDA
jgi:hypothetical protein